MATSTVRTSTSDADPGAGPGAEAVAGSTADGYRPPLRERLSATIFVAPGVVWLGAFFILPLLIIFVVSLGTKDAGGHVSLASPEPEQLPRGDPAGIPAGVRQLAPLRRDHHGPVDPHRLPDRLLDLASRREAQDPPAHPGHAPVLDELPHPDLRLDDHPPRQRGPELDPPRDRADQRPDPPPRLGLRGHPRDDLRLPAVRDPAPLRVDRPDGPEPRPGRSRPVRQRRGAPSST